MINTSSGIPDYNTWNTTAVLNGRPVSELRNGWGHYRLFTNQMQRATPAEQAQIMQNWGMDASAINAGITTDSTTADSSSGNSSTPDYYNDFKTIFEDLYNQQMEMLQPIYGQLLQIMNTQYGWSKEDRARWGDVFRPLEDALVNDANTFATPARRELEAGRATAEVTKAYQAQRDNARRQLESFGIDPSQTRSQALDSQLRGQQAAVSSAAANNARRYVDEQARALRGQAINLGANTANRAAGLASTAAQTGIGTGGLVNNAFNVAGNNARLGVAGAQLAQNQQQLDFNQWLQTQMWNQSQGSAPWWGWIPGALPTIAGLGTGNPSSDTTTSPSQSGVGNTNPVLGPNSTRPGDAGPGVYNPTSPAIPTTSSVPSYATGGPVMDTRPAIPGLGRVDGPPGDDQVPARLKPHEWVMDQETVRWFGEKKMKDMQEKAQQERAEYDMQNPPEYAPPLPTQALALGRV